jgi:hypothetical protein
MAGDDTVVGLPPAKVIDIMAMAPEFLSAWGSAKGHKLAIAIVDPSPSSQMLDSTCVNPLTANKRLKWGDFWDEKILEVHTIPEQKQATKLQDPEHLGKLVSDAVEQMAQSFSREAHGDPGLCYRFNQVLLDGPLECHQEVPEKHLLASWLLKLLEQGYQFTFAVVAGKPGHRESMVRCPYATCSADRNLRMRDQLWAHIAKNHGSRTCGVLVLPGLLPRQPVWQAGIYHPP